MLRLIIQAIILGIVQGLTEFMPISSSAHLVLVPWLLNWDHPALNSLTFDVALHLGTLGAVLVYFATDLWALLRAGIASVVERRIGNDFNRKLAWLLIIATIPAVIVGVLIEEQIDALFHTPGAPIERNAILLIAVCMALLGGALLLAERLARHVRSLEQITLKDALIVGLAQTLALFPGVSRSGSTLTAGLALGFQRQAAARFSFLLSIPVTGGAVAKSLFDLLQAWQSGEVGQSELSLFAVGIVASAISGFLCIHFLLRFLRSNSVNIFVYYRWAAALLVAAVALARG